MLLSLLGGPLCAQGLLDGEFGDIDLGRTLIEPTRFPTVQELRAAVKNPEVSFVLMLRLSRDENNHHLPVWSQHGERLAFQRSKRGVNSSKIFVFPSLSQAEPTLLSDDPEAYDYMFRWGVNSKAGYVFSRIDASQQSTSIVYSPDGEKAESMTSQGGHYVYPSLYERTDGIQRLAYEHDGQVQHEAWSGKESVQAALTVARGVSPRWSRDGSRLVMARERRPGRVADYQIALVNLRTQEEMVIPAAESGVVRSPEWSPDEQYVAYYAQAAGDNSPWRIQVSPLTPGAAPRTVADDVVVNPNFKSQGPAWEPSSRRVWFFSHQRRQQAYYPLVAAGRDSGESLVVHYPRRCTTPNDLAVNPATAIPEMAFVAVDGATQDLFVLFLNHY
jgi:Tol biopolymer transport system component